MRPDLIAERADGIAETVLDVVGGTPPYPKIFPLQVRFRKHGQLGVEVAHWVSKAFPFSHAVDFFQSALFDNDPWETLAREAAWLVGLAVAFGAAARLGMRRLLA